jgi:ribosomal-protein-alanine N-acetyltransferase
MGAPKIENFAERLFPQGKCVTERLVIQPLQAADAFQLVVLTNDPLVANGVSLLRQPFTLADAQDLIALPRAKKGCFASVRLGSNGPFVGCVGAVARAASDIEMGFWLGVPYHGKQYGAEAAQAMLGLLRDAFPDKRIVAECPRENSASWRLLKRLGFCPSGTSGARKGAQLLIFEAAAIVE